MAKKAAPTVTAQETEEITISEVASVTVTEAGVMNPYTKDIIAKSVGGLLDVRRPRGPAFPRPNGIKASPANLAREFGKWYFNEGYCGAEVTAEEVIERTGIKGFQMPDIETDNPFSMFSATIGGAEWCFLLSGGKVVRVGHIGAKAIRWTYSTKHMETRGKSMCPRAINTLSPSEAFRAHLGSFSGVFNTQPEKAAEPVAPAKKSEKAAKVEEKAAKPSKVLPPLRRAK